MNIPRPERYALNPIPPADPNIGFKVRVDRAIDELEAAISAGGGFGGLTVDQRRRLRTLGERVL